MRHKVLMSAFLFFSVLMFAGERPFLGVVFGQAKHGDGESVTIQEVTPGSAAEKAGLRSGDKVVAIDGNIISNSKQLVEMIVQRKVGDTITLDVVRDEKNLSLSAELGAAPDRRSFHPRHKVLFVDENAAWLGVNIENLAGNFAAYFEVDEGVLVKDVVEGGPAATAGLKAGDVIVSIEGHPIATTADIHSVLANFKAGQSVAVGVSRRGQILSQDVQLEARSKHPRLKHDSLHELPFGDFPVRVLEDFSFSANEEMGDHTIHLRQLDSAGLQKRIKSLQEEIAALKKHLQEMEEKED